jgi:hypothetical protein
MDDDRKAPPAERPVLEALVEEAVEHGHVLPRPLDAPPPFGCERRIRDPRHAETLRCSWVHCRGAAR